MKSSKTEDGSSKKGSSDSVKKSDSSKVQNKHNLFFVVLIKKVPMVLLYDFDLICGHALILPISIIGFAGKIPTMQFLAKNSLNHTYHLSLSVPSNVPGNSDTVNFGGILENSLLTAQSTYLRTDLSRLNIHVHVHLIGIKT